MNYSLIQKSIFKIPDDADNGPMKIINSYNFLYSDSNDIIKCINMKTGKINFELKFDFFLAQPYFGLINELN